MALLTKTHSDTTIVHVLKDTYENCNHFGRSIVWDQLFVSVFLFDKNLCPPSLTLSLGNRKKSLEVRSDKYDDQSIRTPFVNCHGDHRYSIFFIFTKPLISTDKWNYQTTTKRPKQLQCSQISFKADCSIKWFDE